MQAKALVKQDGTRPVPMHLRNAPTKLMKELDYGKGYRYAHDEEGGFAAGETLPARGYGRHRTSTSPWSGGLEIRIAEKLRDLKVAKPQGSPRKLVHDIAANSMFQHRTRFQG